MKLHAYAASTKYPNTPESDMMLNVLHTVTLTDGSEREIWAREPMDAIEKMNRILQEETK